MSQLPTNSTSLAVSVVPVEFHELSPELCVWHRYDPQVKADLFSTAIVTAAGLFIIDPISVPQTVLAGFVQGRVAKGVIVTNANHWRDAPEFADRFDVPIYASVAANEPMSASTRAAAELPGALAVVELDGAGLGEIALLDERAGGTLIVGDALINLGSHGFAFLPKKYCTDARQMRRSLGRLLDFQFERLLFAHGAPILSGARTRLARLLESVE